MLNIAIDLMSETFRISVLVPFQIKRTITEFIAKVLVFFDNLTFDLLPSRNLMLFFTDLSLM